MRVLDWESKLAAYIEQAAVTHFAYGTMDCVCFASNAVLAITGIDPMLEGRGQYSDMKGGAALIKQHRGSYAGIMDHYFDRIPPKKAQRGDVVLAFDEKAPAFGVIGAGGRAFFKGRNKGLAVKWPRDCVTAWRVE